MRLCGRNAGRLCRRCGLGNRRALESDVPRADFKGVPTSRSPHLPERAAMSAVLVVDDTADCAEPLARLLDKAGHTVRCAANGREALAALVRFRADVIVLDMHMPVMDGVTFLEALRCNAAWSAVRVVVFTGYGDALPAATLASLGVGEELLKASTDFNRLLKLVA